MFHEEGRSRSHLRMKALKIANGLELELKALGSGTMRRRDVTERCDARSGPSRKANERVAQECDDARAEAADLRRAVRRTCAHRREVGDDARETTCGELERKYEGTLKRPRRRGRFGAFDDRHTQVERGRGPTLAAARRRSSDGGLRGSTRRHGRAIRRSARPLTTATRPRRRG